MTVYRFTGEKDDELLIPEGQTYETPLLPGFVLPLKQLLALADRWAKKRAEVDVPETIPVSQRFLPSVAVSPLHVALGIVLIH